MTTHTTNRPFWQIIIGGTIGNLTEWYNFLLYGYLASVISILFFPATNELLSLSLTFTVFALSFLVRPIGGILFGWIGDKYGRQRALLISLILMTIPTFLIGCLPTYASIGIASPILLCLLRICQGLSAGGEHTGSAVYVAEYAPVAQRARWVSTVPISAAIGILFSMLVSLMLTSYFTPEALLAYGWRYGYWFGTLLCLVSIYLRYYLPETPSFKQLKPAQKNRVPIKQLLRDKHNLKNAAVVLLLASSWGVLYQLIFVWMPAYLSQIIHLPNQAALLINAVFMLFYILLLFVVGYLADHISRVKLLMFASMCLFLCAYPAFVLLSSGTILHIVVAMTLLSISFSLFIPTAFVCMVEAFATEVRYTGMSFFFNLGLALFGGTCPLIATWLIQYSGNLIAPAFYMMIFSAIIGLAAIYIQDKRKQSIA